MLIVDLISEESWEGPMMTTLMMTWRMFQTLAYQFKQSVNILTVQIIWIH